MVKLSLSTKAAIHRSAVWQNFDRAPVFYAFDLPMLAVEA